MGRRNEAQRSVVQKTLQPLPDFDGNDGFWSNIRFYSAAYYLLYTYRTYSRVQRDSCTKKVVRLTSLRKGTYYSIMDTTVAFISLFEEKSRRRSITTPSADIVVRELLQLHENTRDEVIVNPFLQPAKRLRT